MDFNKYLLALILLLCSSSIHAAPTDFNGDGISDPSIVTNSANLNWESIINNIPTSVETNFGQLGQHLCNANYSGTTTQACTIRENGNWVVRVEGSGEVVTYGEDDATYISGGDYNGNGFADFAYSTKACSRKRSHFKVLLDPLGSAVEKTFKAGKGNHFKTFADVNGDGKDDLCYAYPRVIRKVLTNKYRMKCKDVTTGSLVKSFNVGRLYNIPLRIKVPNNPDYILNHNNRRSRTRIKVFNVNGKIIASHAFETKGDLVVGNYTNSDTGIEQIAMVNGTAGTVFDIASKTTGSKSFPQGIVIDDININSFTDDTNGTCYCTAKHIAKNGKCPSPANSCVQRDITDGGGNWLHKPVSESTGSLVNLFNPNDGVQDCSYENISGETISTAYFSGNTNPNRPTYRPNAGGRCSSYPSPLVVTCKVRGEKHCWTIPKPCTRYD